MLSFIVAYSKVITSLKKHGRVFQDMLFRLPARFLYRHEISPDAVSILSMLAVFASSILLFQQNKLYLVTLPLAIFLDMLDGTLARMYSKKEFGALFDFFLDRFSDAMLVLAFLGSGMLEYYFALTLLLFYVLSTLLARLLESMEVKVYILSFRIITVLGLFLQEIHPKAFLLTCTILLINYSTTALFSLPKTVFKPRV